MPVASTQRLAAALLDLRIDFAATTHAVAQSVHLNDGDLTFLELIRRAGQISPTELSRCTATHAATVTGIVRRLEEHGWIERVAHPADRRAVLLRMPVDRAERLTALYQEATCRIDAAGRARTAQERAIVAAYLRDVSAALREAFEASVTTCGRDAPPAPGRAASSGAPG